MEHSCYRRFNCRLLRKLTKKTKINGSNWHTQQPAQVLESVGCAGFCFCGSEQLVYTVNWPHLVSCGKFICGV
uniref:Uncharacterized protein n=1 Tax=Anguilla anguilla TaxID=7936 RepID=A0A0E9WV47_ANGAN